MLVHSLLAAEIASDVQILILLPGLISFLATKYCLLCVPDLFSPACVTGLLSFLIDDFGLCGLVVETDSVVFAVGSVPR